jgi:hypothetical protein
MNRFLGRDKEMTRPYSVAFKQKRVERLTGKDAVSALQLSKECGVEQQNLSRWLREARSLPSVNPKNIKAQAWTVEQKARFLTEGMQWPLSTGAGHTLGCRRDSEDHEYPARECREASYVVLQSREEKARDNSLL